MSQELKDKFADGSELQYTWWHTYVTLGEWQDVLEKETEKWKTDILNLFSKKREDKINDKLDYIISSLISRIVEEDNKEKTEDDNYDEFEENFSYLTDEQFWDIGTIRTEIAKAFLLAEELVGYASDNDIRIIYYFGWIFWRKVFSFQNNVVSLHCQH